jgi:DNA helicase II / ATP-dependent DNA helicase PcrA
LVSSGHCPDSTSARLTRVGGLKFYERLEIKLLLDYLRVVYQPDNNDALVRIINTPKRGIGETTVKNLLEEAETEKKSLWNILFLQFRGNKRALKTKLVKPAPQTISTGLIRIISGLRHRLERAERDPLGTPFSLIELIEQLVKDLDFIDYIKKSYPQEHEGRLANIQEFMTLVADFTRENSLDENLPEIDGLEQRAEGGLLGKFLTNVALATDAQTGEAQDLSSTVTISTIHAAKGLEWPVVFVPAVYNGSLPHSRSENDDEERRLLYVAMTRAKALLYLSYPLHKSQYGSDAKFSEETKLELSDFIPNKIAAKLRAKGPAFEQKMVDEMARILGREAPSLSQVFRDLPPNLPFNMNDESYPADPNDGKRSMDASRDYYDGQNKRQRLYPSQSHSVGQEDAPWRKDYSTTMETSSGFTVSATTLPGFTTAGAHRATMATRASAEGHTGSKNGLGRPAGRGQDRPRPSSTRNLLGYGRGRIKPQGQQELPQQWRSHPEQVDMTFNRPLEQTAILECTKRGLQDVRRRVQSRATERQKNDGHEAPNASYPAFSSPPKGEATSTTEDRENQVSTPLDRSASCFHSTTVTTATGPASGAIRRPPSLARAGIPRMTPLDKLRKPFQPLRVARDSNVRADGTNLRNMGMK